MTPHISTWSTDLGGILVMVLLAGSFSFGAYSTRRAVAHSTRNQGEYGYLLVGSMYAIFAGFSLWLSAQPPEEANHIFFVYGLIHLIAAAWILFQVALIARLRIRQRQSKRSGK